MVPVRHHSLPQMDPDALTTETEITGNSRSQIVVTNNENVTKETKGKQ